MHEGEKSVDRNTDAAYGIVGIEDKAMSIDEKEICANCDREIGKLEKAYVYEDNVVCLECYNRLKKQESCSSPAIVDSSSRGSGIAVVAVPQYAGFWRRVAATFIDGILMYISALIIVMIIIIIGLALAAGGGTTEEMEQGRIKPLLYLFGIVIPWLYFALLESSSKQATVGKMAMGIIVTNVDGNKVSFGRTTGRHFAKFISLLTLFIGFIIAGFTEKKQALHDMIAGCLVVQKV